MRQWNELMETEVYWLITNEVCKLIAMVKCTTLYKSVTLFDTSNSIHNLANGSTLSISNYAGSYVCSETY